VQAIWVILNLSNVMQYLNLKNMTRGATESNFDDSYTLEQMVSVSSGWKVVYQINEEEYFVEEIIAYALIKNGPYCELIPITVQELHLAQPLQEYILKDDYVGLITPENELIVNEHTVEDIKDLNIQAIQEALRKNRVKLG
jgi:sorbitol-specific phosphotransferase system component IIBC